MILGLGLHCVRNIGLDSTALFFFNVFVQKSIYFEIYVQLIVQVLMYFLSYKKFQFYILYSFVIYYLNAFLWYMMTNEQPVRLMVSNYRRIWIPAAPEEAQERCQPSKQRREESKTDGIRHVVGLPVLSLTERNITIVTYC